MGRDMSSFQPVDRTIRRMSVEHRVTVSAAEFHRNVDLYLDIAFTKPVTITKNGRERTVLLSAQEYARLKRRDRRVIAAGELSEGQFATLEFRTDSRISIKKSKTERRAVLQPCAARNGRVDGTTGRPSAEGGLLNPPKFGFSDSLSMGHFIWQVRSELARGDLRALYVGWLLCAQSGELEPIDLSPPVPPGLAKLSGSLTSLVEFLRIDRTLIRVAAEPAAKSRTVADLMQNLEAASRKQSRVIRRTLNI
jgi:prevent-host-death family protein